jgi:hypothetical protein
LVSGRRAAESLLMDRAFIANANSWVVVTFQSVEIHSYS